MATQVTKICSPSKNWKKYWRYASSPRKYCPKTSIKVNPIAGPNLTPNESPVIKRINTGYQGSGLVCRNSPIIPEHCGVAVRNKIFNYRQTLRGLTQRTELTDTATTHPNVSEDQSIVSRKRPSESSPSSVLNPQGPQSPKEQELKNLHDSHNRPTVTTHSPSGQNSSKRFKSTVTKPEENDVYNSESRKRRAETSPPSVLTKTRLESPQKPKLKILRLQERYCAEKQRKQNTPTQTQTTETPNKKRNFVFNEFIKQLDDEESQKLPEKETLLPSRKCTPRFHGVQWPESGGEYLTQATKLKDDRETEQLSSRPNFDDWYNSLRPSLSDINLPVITPDNTMRLNSDNKGNTVILGKGAYGFVTRGELGIGNKIHDCVLKTFRPSRSDREMVLEEARVLHYLANTEVVPKLFGVLESKDPSKLPILVQECFAGGQDIYKLIDKHHASKRDWIKICLNAAEGLFKIHSKQIIINDIKPDNILVDKNNNIRYIDFGMATLDEGFFYPIGPEVERCFQIAPECRKGEETTYRSDIFSFGFVLKSVGDEADVPELTQLSKLLTCAEPYQRINIYDTIRRLKELENNI